MHWAFWLLSAFGVFFTLSAMAVLALVTGIPPVIPVGFVLVATLLVAGVWAIVRQRGRPTA